MATKRIRWEDFDKEIAERLKDDTELLRQCAVDACARGEVDAVRITNEKGLVDQHHYKNSWKHRPTKDGAEVRNDAPHAAVLEHGRRPGRPGPPYAPIREWVQRKLVNTGEIAQADADHVAHLIRSKIHRDGTPPHHVLAAVYARLDDHLTSAVRRRLNTKG